MGDTMKLRRRKTRMEEHKAPSEAPAIFQPHYYVTLSVILGAHFKGEFQADC